MKELISVIVPVYNVKDYLAKCLDSITTQSYKDLEIIVVDDGSTDGSSELCDEYAKKDKRIRVVHQKNAGLSAARNTGIEAAIGKYLMFLDSDDTIDPDVIKTLNDALRKDEVKIAICGRAYTFEDGKKIEKVKENIHKTMFFEEAIEEMNRYILFDMSANGKLFHRELFENLRFPIGKLSEDFFIMPDLFKLAEKVSYISKPNYNYLQRKNSITKNKKINEDFLEAAKEQMKKMENESERLKIITHVAYASAALTVYDFFIKNKVKCPKEKLQKFKKIVKDSKPFIDKYEGLSKAKKIQFLLFGFNRGIYKAIFMIHRRIQRV